MTTAKWSSQTSGCLGSRASCERDGELALGVQRDWGSAAGPEAWALLPTGPRGSPPYRKGQACSAPALVVPVQNQIWVTLRSLIALNSQADRRGGWAPHPHFPSMLTALGSGPRFPSPLCRRASGSSSMNPEGESLLPQLQDPRRESQPQARL